MLALSPKTATSPTRKRVGWTMLNAFVWCCARLALVWMPSGLPTHCLPASHLRTSMLPSARFDMVGVVGSSPIAPTKIGRQIKHLAGTLSAFSIPLWWSCPMAPNASISAALATPHLPPPMRPGVQHCRHPLACPGRLWRSLRPQPLQGIDPRQSWGACPAPALQPRPGGRRPEPWR